MIDRRSTDYSCSCYSMCIQVNERIYRLEKIVAKLRNKDDIIFEQKQEIERLRNKLDDIKKAIKPIYEVYK